jgi:hypothetical protein
MYLVISAGDNGVLRVLCEFLGVRHRNANYLADNYAGAVQQITNIFV